MNILAFAEGVLFIAAILSLPDDPAIPAIAALRANGPSAILPTLDLGDARVELTLRGHDRGYGAIFEAVAGDRHFALKAYAGDPSPEVALYQALAAAGLAGDSGPRVPRLLAWEPALHLFAISWLEGVGVNQLIKGGQGPRAGIVTAAWLHRIAESPVKMGPTVGPAESLQRVGSNIEKLGRAYPDVGAAAGRAKERLQSKQPETRRTVQVHGNLYARHILDLGDGPGVIDWEAFGQGPIEYDAGTYLASLSRMVTRDDALEEETARAKETFLSRTRDILEPRALAWYRAASLLRLASHNLERGPRQASTLVAEANHWAQRVTEVGE